MAKKRVNPTGGDFTGKIGNLVHYIRNGKAYIRRAPVREKPFSLLELARQQRFMLAQQFASGVLTDPRQRARYEQAAAGQDVSAQNVAISDFYRSPTLVEVDLTRYTGRKGDFIRIRAEEGRIGAAQVSVQVQGRSNEMVEAGPASVELDGVTWWYVAQQDIEPDQPLWITVTAADQPGNKTHKTVRCVSGV